MAKNNKNNKNNKNFIVLTNNTFGNVSDIHDKRN